MSHAHLTRLSGGLAGHREAAVPYTAGEEPRILIERIEDLHSNILEVTNIVRRNH
jgi:hypothetical protein